MPLLLGTKRTHDQTSSDVDDDAGCSHSVRTLASSSSLPTPATTRHAPSAATPNDDEDDRKSGGRKRKMARYSIPSESPTNVFRVGNELYYRGIKKGPKTLPAPVLTLLELRFQMKGSKVFRTVRVPSSYTLAHVNQLIFFLFGWSDTHNASEQHQWCVVKEVVQHSAEGRVPREGEIKTCREWVDVVPESQLEARRKDKSNQRRVEDENEWTVGQVWGAGGVFTERGVIWDRNKKRLSTIDITLCQPTKATTATNLPWLIRAKGAPSQESSKAKGKEHPDGKGFRLRSFTGPAFERYLNDEITTLLGTKELVAVTHAEAAKLTRDRARFSRSYRSPSLSEQEDSGEEDELDPEEYAAQRVPLTAGSEYSD
ncbi:hypothetical protein FRB94_006700 [Tulasnella sp. JGI-2019a]|nr:hypothetical protein FRB93_002868 [Tulasnella sp. JGI-2019a]KAG8998722.1 hypothetical protein FRB94_006700 [Tulasnella sp. JGI-2019a]KAG9027884.1 hypothetical protein FRB95_007082 [Tulasnella sp. JGI-2019a]